MPVYGRIRLKKGEEWGIFHQALSVCGIEAVTECRGDKDMENQVQVTINGKAVTVDSGTSVLAASMRAGVRHMHLCGGHGLCSTCRVRVLEGAEHLSEVTPFERISLRLHLSFAANVRLACQAKVNGPAKIETIFPTIGKLDFKGS